MKFNSQVATNRSQSERLLALGLKKETADMVHFFSQSLAQDWTIVPLAENEIARNIEGVEIPSWSLHRLIEMIGEEIQTDWQSMCLQDKVFTKRDVLYDNIVDCIEWLIKEGYFNKDYLEETL